MLKKLIIVFSLLVIVAGIVIGVFYLKRINKTIADPQQFIASDAVFVIKAKYPISWNKLTKENAYWNSLVGINFYDNIDTYGHKIDSVLNANKAAFELVNGQTFYLNGYYTSSTQLDIQYIINLKSIVEEEDVIKLVKNIFAKNSNLKSRDFKGKTIEILQFSNSKIQLYFTYCEGNIVLSTSESLVENAIRQFISNTGIQNNKTFNKVTSIAGKDRTLTLFINHQYFPKVFGGLISSSITDVVMPLNESGTWTELDITLESKSVMVNGFTASNDLQTINTCKILNDQKPQRTEITKIIPNNTNFFINYGISNYPAFSVNFKAFLKSKNLLANYEAEQESLNASLKLNAELHFSSWLGNEFAMVIAQGINDSSTENSYAVFKTTDSIETLSKLAELTNASGIKKITSQSYRGYEIKNLGISQIIPIIFGKSFALIKNSYYVIVGNYVVFANSTSALQNILNYYLSEQTLELDPSYIQFKSNIPEESNCFVYAKTNKILLYSANIFSGSVNNAIHQNIRDLSKFKELAWQISNYKNQYLFHTFNLTFNPITNEKPTIVWESELDSKPIIKPTLVTNHITNQYDIFVQDLSSQIYLIDNKGAILWKKEIDGPIISDIFEVDLLKNNKIQYLFNTQSNIYLIDRDGKFAANYPVKLKSPATNGIAVFDYEKNKDYRILIACENKGIFNLKLDGKQIDGWKFGKSSAVISKPLQHEIVAGKDYLVAIDNKGEAYFLDRKGNSKLKSKTQAFTISQNPFFIEKTKSASTSRIIATDTSGTIFSIFFDGKVSKAKPNNYSSHHYFNYIDALLEKDKQYIFADKNQVIAQHNNTSLFTTNMDKTIVRPPMIFNFNDGAQKIGIVSDNKLFMIKNDGSLDTNFPISGNSQFSIGDIYKNRKRYLITGNDKKITCYKLN